MSHALDQITQNQINKKNINAQFIVKINGLDCTDYLMTWNVSYSTQFGSASATFTLNNNLGYFGSGGTIPINVGDLVELIELFQGSSTQWKSFYGTIEQRTFKNSSNDRSLELVCLDYIGVLKHLDIDLVVEGTKVQIANEVLQPQFLPAPNDMFAQVFNFANNSIAQNPIPVFTFIDKLDSSEDPQYQGFEIEYSTGQVKLGSPLQARDNYQFKAKSYFFYTIGVYCEDVLEQILTQSDGYGGYLFGEFTAQDVINNHLTTTFSAEEGIVGDVLTPNYTSSTIDIYHTVTVAISTGDVTLTLDSIDGLPTTGQGKVNGNIFTWTGISGTILTGIPATGAFSLVTHPVNSFMIYTNTYPTGQVWFLKYSNVSTNLINSNFTIPGAILTYFDKRNGSVILNTNINLTATVICNIDYTLKSFAI